MSFKIMIAGVDRSDKVTNVKFELHDNERATLSFDCEPDFEPARRSTVLVYDSDNTTERFGGLIFNKQYRGLTPGSSNAVLSCQCVDNWFHIERLTVDAGSFTGTKTIKQVAQWFQTNYLAARGFTLDAAQADGPSVTVDGFSWERTLGTEALRQISEAYSGWRFRSTPGKVWGFYSPSTATPTAPFAISDSDAHASEVEWSETEEDYYDKIIGRFGGSETREHTTLADTGDLIALGYFITDIPSTPTGLVTVSVTGSVTLTDVVAGAPGATGTYFNWDWAAHKLIVGTLYTPQVGDNVSLKYTAQYPFEIIQGTGLLELVVSRPEVTDYATALSVMAGLYAKHYQDVREFTVYTDEAGLAPGQVLSITRTDRAVAATNTAIISVDHEPVTSEFWKRTAKAISGIYQRSPLDYFRSIGGGGSSSVGYTPTYTGGGTSGVTGYPLTKSDDTNVTLTLGGSHSTALVNPASIAVGWQGILAVSRGGTGVSSITANRIPYGNGTSAIQTSANLTFNGTTLSMGAAAVAALTSGRVVYATTSGQLTDSAALTFDGSTLSATILRGTNLTTGRVPFATTGGSLTDNAAFSFDGTNLAAPQIIDGGLTSGRVTYASTAGLLVDSANLTFSGTTLTAHTLAVSTGNATFAANANPVINYTSNLGNLVTKYLTVHAAELWVSTLVAQETIATIGGSVIVAPSTRLSADLPPGQGYAKFGHNQMDHGDLIVMWSNGKLEWHGVLSWTVTGVSTVNENFVVASDQTAFFPAGAIFVVRGSTGNNGTWTVSTSTYNSGPNTTTINVTGNVTNATADGYIAYTILPADGQYTYLINRDLDGTGQNQWYAGDGVVNTGTTGDGYIDMFSTNGILSGFGPTIIGNVRTGTSYNNVAPRWAIGNLRDIYNNSSADLYGVAFGNPSASYIQIDATNGINFNNGATTKFSVDTSGNLALTGNLTLGTSGVLKSGATAYGTGTGFWLAYNGGTPQFRVGNPAGGQLAWDGSALTAAGWTIGASTITGGNATLASSGNLTLGTSNDVARLSADDATYRLWIGHATAGSAPFRVTKAGALTATNATITGSSGSVIIDNGGITVNGNNAYTYVSTSAYNFGNMSATGDHGISGEQTGTANNGDIIRIKNSATGATRQRIIAEAMDSTKTARLTLDANGLGSSGLATLEATNTVYLNAPVVKFGTHTAVGSETLSGYVEITDAGGTVRKLAVIS